MAAILDQASWIHKIWHEIGFSDFFAYFYITLYLVVAILYPPTWLWYSNFRFVISDPKNLGIPSCTRKYQMEVNLGVKNIEIVSIAYANSSMSREPSR